MEKSFISVQPTKAHQKRRLFSIFRTKGKQGISKSKADHDDQFPQDLNTSGLVDRDSATLEDHATSTKLRRLFAPWKSLFHLFTKTKRSFCSAKTDSAPQDLADGSISEVAEMSNLVEDLANLAMAITLPINVTGTDLKVNIELNATLIGIENQERSLSRLLITEKYDNGAVYSGNIKVPSMTTIEDVSKMPIYLLNGNSTESQHKIETIIKPIQGILPEVHDRTRLIDELNLNLHIANTNTSSDGNPNELMYAFVHNGFIKKPVDRIKLDEFLDQITKDSKDKSKELVKEILNGIVSKVSLKKSSSDFTENFNKELEIQKGLLLKKSSSLLTSSSDSNLSKISRLDLECIPTTSDIFKRPMEPIQAVVTSEDAQESESKVDLMAPSNTPDAFMPTYVMNQNVTDVLDDLLDPKQWANKKAMRDEVQADIDKTLELLETAKDKLLHYLSQPLISEMCYDVVESYKTAGLDSSRDWEGTRYECQKMILIQEIHTNRSETLVNKIALDEQDVTTSFQNYKQFSVQAINCDGSSNRNLENTAISKMHLDDDDNRVRLRENYSQEKMVKPVISQYADNDNEGSNTHAFANRRIAKKNKPSPEVTLSHLISNVVLESDNVIGESNPSKKAFKSNINTTESVAKSSYCDPFIICGFEDNEYSDAALTKEQSELIEEYRFESVNDATFTRRYTGAASLRKLPMDIIQRDKEIMIREIVNESMHIRDIIVSAVGDFVDEEMEMQKTEVDEKVNDDVKHILGMLLQQVDEQSSLNQLFSEVEPFLPSPNKVYQVYPVYFCLIDDYVDVFPAAAGSTSHTAGIAHRGRNKNPKVHARSQQGGRTTISVRRQCSHPRRFGALQRTDGLLNNLERGVTFVSELCKEIYAGPTCYCLNSNRNLNMNSNRGFRKSRKVNNLGKETKIAVITSTNNNSTDPGKDIVEYIKRCKNIECKYPLSGSGIIAWQKHWLDLLTKPLPSEVEIVLGKHLSNVIKCEHIVQMANKLYPPFGGTKEEDNPMAIKHLKTSKDPKVSKIDLDCDNAQAANSSTSQNDFIIYSSEELVQSTNLIKDISSQETILQQNSSDFAQGNQFGPFHPLVTANKSFKFCNDQSYDPYAASTSNNNTNNVTFPSEDSLQSSKETLIHTEFNQNRNIVIQKRWAPVADIPRRFDSSCDELNYWQNLKIIHKNVFGSRDGIASTSSCSEQDTPPITVRKLPFRLPTISDINLVQTSEESSLSSGLSVSSDPNSAGYDADTEIIENMMPNLQLLYVSKMELNAPEDIANIETNVQTNDRLNPTERSSNSKDFQNVMNRRHAMLDTSSESSSLSLTSETSGVEVNL